MMAIAVGGTSESSCCFAALSERKSKKRFSKQMSTRKAGGREHATKDQSHQSGVICSEHTDGFC